MPAITQMPSAKTRAMYQALQNRYNRLVQYGAQQMLPNQMAAFLDQLSQIRAWATNPLEEGDPDLPTSPEQMEEMREQLVLQRYRVLMPQVEEMEARIRRATPGGLPEEKLITPEVAAPSRMPNWLPWAIGGAVILGAIFLLRK